MEPPSLHGLIVWLGEGEVLRVVGASPFTRYTDSPLSCPDLGGAGMGCASPQISVVPYQRHCAWPLSSFSHPHSQDQDKAERGEAWCSKLSEKVWTEVTVAERERREPGGGEGCAVLSCQNSVPPCSR